MRTFEEKVQLCVDLNEKRKKHFGALWKQLERSLREEEKMEREKREELRIPKNPHHGQIVEAWSLGGGRACECYEDADRPSDYRSYTVYRRSIVFCSDNQWRMLNSDERLEIVRVGDEERRLREQESLRKQAMAKLTGAERKALGL